MWRPRSASRRCSTELCCLGILVRQGFCLGRPAHADPPYADPPHYGAVTEVLAAGVGRPCGWRSGGFGVGGFGVGALVGAGFGTAVWG